MFTKHLPKKYTPVILIALALLTLLVAAIVADLDSRVDFLWNNKTDVATSTSEAVDTSSWETYRNEEYGFEFKYPEGWVLEQNFSYSISISKSGASYGHIAATERNPDGLSINRWFEQEKLPPLVQSSSDWTR